MALELVFETHATTEDNERGVATGWLPGRLSAEGQLQAGLLGERRRDTGLAAVFTSDLARAVQTAAIAFQGGSVPVLQDARLRECDYGRLNGAPRQNLEPRRRFVDKPFPGGQSYLDVVAATRSFLHDVRADWDGTRVLLIAHSANRWALQHLLEDIPLEDLVTAPFDWRPGWSWTLPCTMRG